MKRESTRTGRIILTVTLLSAGVVTSAASASATTSTTECHGELVGGSYANVVVPAGATCLIQDALVYGSIRVLAEARLFSFDNQVYGNIVGEGAASTRSVRNMVHGNFVVRGGGPAPVGPTALLCGTTLGGSAVIEGTAGGIGVRYSPVPGLDPPTAPHCEANRIGGNLVVRGNTMTRPLLILGNEIGGNAVVTNNTGSGAKTVSANTVGASLVCTENTPPFDGSGNSAAQLIGQCTT